MKNSSRPVGLCMLSLGLFGLVGCAHPRATMPPDFHHYTLDDQSPADPSLQARLEALNNELCTRHGLDGGQAAVGLLDLRRPRLAVIHPDRIEYAASVPKIGILLAYFQLHASAATNLDAETRRELGLMIKVSSNELAAKYSAQMGLRRVQEVIDSYGLYDRDRGGGLWVGKHYGRNDERSPDPVGGHSHAATVRQLLRFYLMLEQGRLVSPQASQTMRAIFESPGIPHDDHKFVRGLAGRNLEIIRKSGSWEDWLHDTAVVTGPGRHYILVALTRHANGDAYLADLARRVDDFMADHGPER